VPLLVCAAAQETHALCAGGERGHVVARGVADRGGAEDHVHRTRAGSCHAVHHRTVADGADEDVHLAVAVEVSGVAVQAVSEIISCRRAPKENTGIAQARNGVVCGGLGVGAENEPD